jgi:hypothetical protein
MKSIIWIVALSLFSTRAGENKMSLICNSWKLVGIQSFSKEYKPANVGQGENLTFHANGTYEKVLYGQLKLKGDWSFRVDSTKLEFTVDSMNGTKMPSTPLGTFKPTDSIAKLTTDTLIIARLAYYGPDRVYGHDDWYYVRVDNGAN